MKGKQTIVALPSLVPPDDISFEETVILPIAYENLELLSPRCRACCQARDHLCDTIRIRRYGLTNRDQRFVNPYGHRRAKIQLIIMLPALTAQIDDADSQFVAALAGGSIFARHSTTLVR